MNFAASTPASELKQRILDLQAAMADSAVDACLIIQKTDLFYYSGTAQQGWLYVPVSGEPLLMVFKDFDRARSESTLQRVASVVSPKRIPGELADWGYAQPGHLGMELDVVPANLYLQFAALFSGCRISDISMAVRLQRAVKSAYEIAILRRAAALADRVAAKAPDLLRPGRSEIEVAGELEGFARSLGHQGIVRMRMWGGELFYGHLLCGPAAAAPSYLASPTGGCGVNPAVAQGAGFNVLQPGQPILLDYVFALDGYLADHARIFVLGDLEPDLLQAHERMLELQEAILPLAVPGVPSGELYAAMVDMAEKQGFGPHFMGVGDRRIRFTGHGIGLELDEYPFLARGQELPLEAGMVIALEPKVILPGRGVVGIENTHLVTAGGLERLTRFDDAVTRIPL